MIVYLLSEGEKMNLTIGKKKIQLEVKKSTNHTHRKKENPIRSKE